MEHLNDELPNFSEVLDDIRRKLALGEDSRDALEITPLLLLGPPGVGKTHFARALADLQLSSKKEAAKRRLKRRDGPARFRRRAAV